MRSYAPTSRLTTAKRSGKCHFCEKEIVKDDQFWWYPKSRRAFHTQCKGISKNAQKGVTTRIMSPEELKLYRAERGIL